MPEGRDYSKWKSKGDFSRGNIDRMKSKGVETPRTNTKKNYREDMARTDYSNAMTEKGRQPQSKTPARYYKNFDRGAARSSKRRGRRSSR